MSEKKFDSVHWLMALAGLLAGMGIMLIFLTATAEPRLKCTWPETDQVTTTVNT